jgi:hypothetical protein
MFTSLETSDEDESGATNCVWCLLCNPIIVIVEVIVCYLLFTCFSFSFFVTVDTLDLEKVLELHEQYLLELEKKAQEMRPLLKVKFYV